MATQGRGHTTQPRPFFNARTHTAEYAGPGREVRPPDDVAEVKIGWFGPADPDHPTAGLMWQAATLAVEEANQSGGYNGLPFRLVSSWSENPWSSGVAGVTRLVYDSKVWAITGAPDGPSAHLVEQIVAKARRPVDILLRPGRPPASTVIGAGSSFTGRRRKLRRRLMHGSRFPDVYH